MNKSAKIVAVYRELRMANGTEFAAGELLACAITLVDLLSAVRTKPATKLRCTRQWIDMLSINEAWGHHWWYVFCRDYGTTTPYSGSTCNGLASEKQEIWINRRIQMHASRYGLALAAKEHIAGGQPLTRLEAMVLYGVANLPDLIKEMRNQGFVIKSRLVTYAAAAERINRHAVLQPPSNLPVREVHVTEYWMSK